MEVCVSFSVVLCFHSGKDLRKPRVQLMSQVCFPDLLLFFPNHVPLGASVVAVLKALIVAMFEPQSFACITSLIT